MHTLYTRLTRCSILVQLLTHHSLMHMRMQLAQKCSSTKAGAPCSLATHVFWQAAVHHGISLPGCLTGRLTSPTLLIMMLLLAQGAGALRQFVSTSKRHPTSSNHMHDTMCYRSAVANSCLRMLYRRGFYK